MKLDFGIPPKEHRGWPGYADVDVDKDGLLVVPCGASGGMNEGHPYRYALSVSPSQLLRLAWRIQFLKLRFTYACVKHRVHYRICKALGCRQ